MLVLIHPCFGEINHSIQEQRVISIKVMQEVNHLKQALYHSSQNVSRLEIENSQLKRHLNATLEEKAELQLTLIQQKDRNRKMLAILSSNKLSFIWSVCHKDTLQCSSCPPGWTEHSLRCFMISTTAKKWEDARRECLDNHGDLAVVVTAKDQAFLTNFTIQFVRRNPQLDFHSAWIGLQDMVQEGTFIWVNGEKVKSNLSYWREMEPNNAIASWDADSSGQDCVAIVPPKSSSGTKWLNSWDDIICGGKRHFICEVPALV
ncbi:hepatic lectin [Oryzias melastigma]|uniref:hepatic lectin n=1 Tax=Oryzias melastigma TaxID=30732 RepID=UPI00168D4BA5|nr:hepatic lectin [Oryzias melastigma]